MSDKKIVQYTRASFYGDPVGKNIRVYTIDHPDINEFIQSRLGLNTSTVVSYDETTGHIETQNTLYVPATSTVSAA